MIESVSLFIAGNWLKDEIQLIGNGGSSILFSVARLNILQQTIALTPSEDLRQNIEDAVNDSPGSDCPQDCEKELLPIPARKRRSECAAID